MLKRLLNECVLMVELEATGRLLIKESSERTEQQVADHKVAQPERTRHPDDGRETIFLPGASLKGALRAQAERIARSLNQHGAGSCNPFAVSPRQGVPPVDLACSERMKVRMRREQQNGSELTIPQRYQDACPICRTFGHLGWGRRLRITDFYPVAEPGSVEITHISVDRIAGGVSTPYKGKNVLGSGRTFNVAYSYKAWLRGRIVLENFTLWQLGLLGFLWRDLAEGLIPVGHKQTTGTGDLRPASLTLHLTRLGTSPPAAGELCGIGALFDDAAAYGYDADADRLAWPSLQWRRPDGAIRWETVLDQTAAEQLWQKLAPKAAGVLREHQWPESMSPTRILALGGDES